MKSNNAKSTILITGARGLVGRVLVAGFLREGFRVVGVSRTPPDLEKTQAKSAGSIRWVAADLLTEAGVTSVVTACDDKDVNHFAVVHAARQLNTLSPANGSWSADSWSNEFALAVTAAFRLTMQLREIADERLQSVVLLSSMYGVVAVNPNLYEDANQRAPVHYGVVRAAVIQLARELAVRLAPKTRVNALTLGGVKGRVDDSFERRYAALCPAGRMLDENDLFGPVAFLATDASSGMTGQNLIVDGGWTAW